MNLPILENNIITKKLPFTKEFISYVLEAYLIDGKNVCVIEKEYSNDDLAGTGAMASKVLNNFGLITNEELFNNRGIYRENNINDVADFLLNQEDNRYKSIGAALSMKKVDNKSENIEKYDRDSFLKEVFIDDDKYDTMVALLERNKNLIIQGAPGVGKTFMAKRLAYSIMGQTDSSRVKLIQFHQSYSYEEFVEGYRPKENGFELKKGIFYNYCKEAREDEEKRPYYLIIDEINRGNVSKIFGELLMLIEGDKREESLTLAYSEEEFSVPENLYIIGLMNTADRSLALIDYALRRRFSFMPVEPAFDNEKFKEEFQRIFDADYSGVIELIKNINTVIEKDPSLGSGFKIGHSYFCPKLNGRKGTKKDIDDILKYEIEPLLREYWYDDDEELPKWISAIEGVINDQSR